MPDQAIMHFAPFRLPELVRELRRTHFPWLRGIIPCEFSAGIDVVACAIVEPLVPGQPERGFIKVNVALNRPDTPVEVMRAILKHELLHFEVRPEREDGQLTSHPRSFWMRQFELSPEFAPTCEWLERTYGRAYRRVDGTLVIRGQRVRKGGRRRVLPARKSEGR